MTEQPHIQIDKNQLQALVKRINAGEHPDLSNYATISPILDAIADALFAVKPQTEQLQQYLSYVKALQSKHIAPRVRHGLLPISESIDLTFGSMLLNQATPRQN